MDVGDPDAIPLTINPCPTGAYFLWIDVSPEEAPTVFKVPSILYELKVAGT